MRLDTITFIWIWQQYVQFMCLLSIFHLLVFFPPILFWLWINVGKKPCHLQWCSFSYHWMQKVFFICRHRWEISLRKKFNPWQDYSTGQNVQEKSLTQLQSILSLSPGKRGSSSTLASSLCFFLCSHNPSFRAINLQVHTSETKSSKVWKVGKLKHKSKYF